MVRVYFNRRKPITLRFYKGSLAWELQVGKIVLQFCHSGQKFQGKRFHAWVDSYGYWPWS